MSRQTDTKDTAKEDGGEGRRRRGFHARQLSLALLLGGLAAGMVGVSFAAVPLYRIFCQVTGYAGTTQRAESGAKRVLDRTVTVRFDANVSPHLGWTFKPVQHKLVVRLGETTLAFFKATNNTGKRITGTATFNVTPEIAGSYFNKIQCFCFTEQTLEPGQSADMPVTFYVDPDIADDPEANYVTDITLSYTFFPAENDDAGPSAAPHEGS